MTRIRIAALSLAAGALICVPASAHAQFRALREKIEKKVAQEQPSGLAAPPAFDNVTLELTPERIAKVVAGKKAGRAVAESPAGPAAIQKQIDALDERQAAIYQKSVDQINGYDGQRMDFDRCVDSVLSEIHDKKQAAIDAKMQDPAQVAELAKKLQASARDTGMQRSTMGALSAVATKADSADARSACKGPPEPPPTVREWLSLQEQLKILRDKLVAAEAAVFKAEQNASGMTGDQLAMACERLQWFTRLYSSKKPIQGFTAAEIEALTSAQATFKESCD